MRKLILIIIFFSHSKFLRQTTISDVHELPRDILKALLMIMMAMICIFCVIQVFFWIFMDLVPLWLFYTKPALFKKKSHVCLILFAHKKESKLAV